jgi:hypothetical protein
MCMLEASQNEGDGEREIKKMGIGPTNMTSEDVSRSKRMVYKRGIMTKKGNLVHLQVCCPPNTFGQSVKNIQIACLLISPIIAPSLLIMKREKIKESKTKEE